MELIFLHIFFFSVRVATDIGNRVSRAGIPVAGYYTIGEHNRRLFRFLFPNHPAQISVFSLYIGIFMESWQEFNDAT